MRGSVYKRCGCREATTGRRKGAGCPHLTRPGHGSWYLTLEVPAGADGHRRRVRLGGHRTRADAVAALRQLQAVDAGPGQGWTVGGWLRRWLASRSWLRPATLRMYESHVNTYLAPHLGRVPLAALTAADLSAMFSAISHAHKLAGEPLSPTTLHSIRCTLRAALNAAIREGLLTSNPARWVELPTHRRPHAVVWTPSRVAAWRAGSPCPPVAVWTAADTARFLSAVADDRLGVLFRLVAVTGLRRGEVAGLCWPDLDLTDATLTVSRTLHRQRGRYLLMPPKSQASARTVPLDRTTVALLTVYQREQRAQLPAWQAGGFVFTRANGSPLDPSGITHRFRALQQQHGLPPIRLHDLRHGAATLGLASGADLKAIQALLGHASIVLTADTYTSVLPEVARRTVDGIAELILQAGRLPPGRTSDGSPVHPARDSTGEVGAGTGPSRAVITIGGMTPGDPRSREQFGVAELTTEAGASSPGEPSRATGAS